MVNYSGRKIMQKIVIDDYELGNLGSIYNMLKYINVPSEISSDRTTIEKADKLILPGAGAFDQGMCNLSNIWKRQTGN
jgi:glutamine amidotransferase